MKIKILDTEPTIGIWALVDGVPLILEGYPEEFRADARGYVDAGKFFHMDLLKKALDDPRISEETKKSIEKTYKKNPYGYHRGRICYDTASDTYDFYASRSFLQEYAKEVNMIVRMFHLPMGKTNFYADPSYDDPSAK